MAKELAKTYDPKGIEDKIYQNWLDKKYFHAEVDHSKTPFTIVIPPPNITGQLHMGHALDNTMQDILIRYKRMQGYNALWQPGTDHASIATEVKMIEKMKDVFRIFYENREEVALLWRPHPLIKATIESMRPQLWKEYEQMMEEYRKAGWGIYDDTAELERAIELSDAYYGDESSLVQLCQKKEILIMIQNVEIRNKKYK